MMQLNERLSQFIAAREIDRLTHPDERVARMAAEAAQRVAEDNSHRAAFLSRASSVLAASELPPPRRLGARSRLPRLRAAWKATCAMRSISGRV